MESSLSYGGGGLNAFYWRQIFALDSVVVKSQRCLAHMEASLLMQCIITEKQSHTMIKQRKWPMTHR